MHASFALALAVLAYASHRDLKSREVSDLVWLVGCPVGLALSLAGLLAGKLSPIQLLASISVSACLGATLFLLGLVGGADALAFLFLGLTVPAYPDGFPLFADALTARFSIPVFTVLCNAVLLSLACPLAVFTLNLADLVRGRSPFKGVEVNGAGDLLVLMFTARRVSLERLLSGLHYFPAERLVLEGGKAARKPAYFVRAEADLTGITAEMAEHRELYAEGVLASPTMPMIVFLTLGLVLALFGNFVMLAVSMLFGF